MDKYFSDNEYTWLITLVEMSIEDKKDIIKDIQDIWGLDTNIEYYTQAIEGLEALKKKLLDYENRP